MSPVIVAVDDNQAHAYALRKLLEQYGYTVMEAHNGEDAVILTQQHKPDLLLLDVNLPDSNGFPGRSGTAWSPLLMVRRVGGETHSQPCRAQKV